MSTSYYLPRIPAPDDNRTGTLKNMGRELGDLGNDRDIQREQLRQLEENTSDLTDLSIGDDEKTETEDTSLQDGDALPGVREMDHHLDPEAENELARLSDSLSGKDVHDLLRDCLTPPPNSFSPSNGSSGSGHSSTKRRTPQSPSSTSSGMTGGSNASPRSQGRSAANSPSHGRSSEYIFMPRSPLSAGAPSPLNLAGVVGGVDGVDGVYPSPIPLPPLDTANNALHAALNATNPYTASPLGGMVINGDEEEEEDEDEDAFYGPDDEEDEAAAAAAAVQASISLLPLPSLTSSFMLLVKSTALDDPSNFEAVTDQWVKDNLPGHCTSEEARRSVVKNLVSGIRTFSSLNQELVRPLC